MFQFVGIAASAGITDVSDIMSEVLKEKVVCLLRLEALHATSYMYYDLSSL